MKCTCFILRSILLLAVLMVIIYVNTGCSLSKSQIKTCNIYFKELDDFYRYANEINEHTANVKFNKQKLIASSEDSTRVLLTILDSAVSTYQEDVSMPFELKKSLLEIDNYVSGYSFKSSYDTEFLVNFRTFLVEYIPLGIGNILYNIVYATRKIIIKPNIGKKIKAHVASGNQLIHQGADIIIMYANDYSSQLEQEKKVIKEGYLGFVEKLHHTSDSWENYSLYNPIFITNYKELFITQQMTGHLVAACEHLELAQAILYTKTRKHRKIKQQIPELTDFYVEISYLRDLEKLLKE